MIYEIQGGLIIKEIWRPATKWPTCCWRDMGMCCTGTERSGFSQLVCCYRAPLRVSASGLGLVHPAYPGTEGPRLACNAEGSVGNLGTVELALSGFQGWLRVWLSPVG